MVIVNTRKYVYKPCGPKISIPVRAVYIDCYARIQQYLNSPLPFVIGATDKTGSHHFPFLFRSAANSIADFKSKGKEFSLQMVRFPEFLQNFLTVAQVQVIYRNRIF